MNREHIKVGNTIWLKGINNFRKHPLKEYPIIKVGRKYFYVDMDYCTLSFSLETFEEKEGKYISNYVAYATEMDYLNAKEKRRIWADLSDYFRYSRCLKDISLEKLREIKLLIS